MNALASTPSVMHARDMALRNLVTAVERDPRGMLLRLTVGIADLDEQVWLAKPVPLSALSIARRIRAGESFQALRDGELGPMLWVESCAGVDVLVEADDGPPSGFQLDDLPPC